jgi:hypothetical protein
MKVPLHEQIEEAERYRDSLRELREEGVKFTEGPDLETRLDSAEGIVLTLRLIQVTEIEFREFMRQRRTNHKEEENG